MRKNHYILICALSLSLWVFVSHYVFLGRSNNEFSNNIGDVDKALSDLSADINSELEIHNLMMESVQQSIVQKKRALEKAEQENMQVVINNEKFHYSKDAIAIVVIACNRVTVSRCLDLLIKYRPSVEKFPIIVSQDCNHEATTNVIKSYQNQVHLIQQPNQQDIAVPPKEKKFKGYFKIARHYGWALNQMFYEFNFSTAIVIEDDLDIAPDFFEYFLGTYPLLISDPTLWCVSAWNDNGKPTLIDTSSSDLLYRTDFFPGLGWMLTKDLWDEISVKWPRSYWDDWIRQPEQRKDRACIRPEISRTRTFGKIGVSNGMYFDKHLKFIHLNDHFVPFTKLNLTYLLRENYDVEYVKLVYSLPTVTYDDLKMNTIKHDGAVRIAYYTKDQFRRNAKFLGLMDDFRSGVPRTGYRGIVSFIYNSRRVFLAPHPSWRGYDPTW
ncbi:alpha-1,3-mannosyl-glycoprotein 2-beta-N-acetylglucosaminyltransferase [Diaphorina citri]|jgi:GNT-I family.|uniref:Alpha-1,3-mannosyl-glycoprotein 2-beta-N-acetylglucosaminyltransferase n=1 Tax=Diaphorina citri TaxID=121845 RepID=A0A1S3D9R7_DIACI|nr:alpha-1,3-mannosyl-glycoprotein 2-beta-N-acetylglucosaminyltransferase [Diaphorina citri]